MLNKDGSLKVAFTWDAPPTPSCFLRGKAALAISGRRFRRFDPRRAATDRKRGRPRDSRRGLEKKDRQFLSRRRILFVFLKHHRWLENTNTNRHPPPDPTLVATRRLPCPPPPASHVTSNLNDSRLWGTGWPVGEETSKLRRGRGVGRIAPGCFHYPGAQNPRCRSASAKLFHSIKILAAPGARRAC